MSLAARCDGCGTVFKIVQDQLSVSTGWVRCGRCGAVFNALAALADVPGTVRAEAADPPSPGPSKTTTSQCETASKPSSRSAGADGSETTVAQFAERLHRSPSELLRQLAAAGVPKKSPDDTLTDSEKERLLEHLRHSRGNAGSGQKPIKIRRVVPGSQGQAASGDARTILVEVRKKRVFVKRDQMAQEADAAPASMAAHAKTHDPMSQDEADEWAQRWGDLSFGHRDAPAEGHQERTQEFSPLDKRRSDRDRSEAGSVPVESISGARPEPAAPTQPEPLTKADKGQASADRSNTPRGSERQARCPGCKAIYPIGHKQPRLWNVWVNCGQCGVEFNASANLVNENAPGNRAKGGGSTIAPSAVVAAKPAATGPTPSLGEILRTRRNGAQGSGDRAPKKADAPAVPAPSNPSAKGPLQSGPYEPWVSNQGVPSAPDDGARLLATLESIGPHPALAAEVIRNRIKDGASAEDILKAGIVCGIGAAKAGHHREAVDILCAFLLDVPALWQLDGWSCVSPKWRGNAPDALGVLALAHSCLELLDEAGSEVDSALGLLWLSFHAALQCMELYLAQGFVSLWRRASLDQQVLSDEESDFSEPQSEDGLFHDLDESLGKVARELVKRDRHDLAREVTFERLRFSTVCVHRTATKQVALWTWMKQHADVLRESRSLIGEADPTDGQASWLKRGVGAAMMVLDFELPSQSFGRMPYGVRLDKLEIGLLVATADAGALVDWGDASERLLCRVPTCMESVVKRLVNVELGEREGSFDTDDLVKFLDDIEQDFDLPLVNVAEIIARNVGQRSAKIAHSLGSAWFDALSRLCSEVVGVVVRDVVPRFAGHPDLRLESIEKSAGEIIAELKTLRATFAWASTDGELRRLGAFQLERGFHRKQYRALYRQLRILRLSTGLRFWDGQRLRKTLGRLGSVAMSRDRPDLAVKFFVEAVDVSRSLVSQGDESIAAKSSLARALRDLADARSALDQQAEADRLVVEALELKCAVLEVRGPERSPGWLNAIAERRKELADRYVAIGDRVAAAREAARHVEARKAFLDAHPRRARFIRGLLRAIWQAGEIEAASGRRAEARATFESGRTLVSRLFEVEGRSPAALRDSGALEMRIGDLLRELEGLSAAKDRYLKCLALDRERQGKKDHLDSPELALCVSLDRLGECEELLGRLEAARSCYEEQLSIAETLANTSRAFRRPLEAWGHALQRLGRLELSVATAGEVVRAYDYLGRSTNIARRIIREFGEDAESSRALSIALTSQGDVSARQGWWHDAVVHYGQALALDRRAADQRPGCCETLKRLRDNLGNAGRAEMELGPDCVPGARERFVEAVATARHVIELEGANSQNLREAFLGLVRLGQAERRLKHDQDAVAAATSAVEALLGVNVKMASWPADARQVSELLAQLVADGGLPSASAFRFRAELWVRVAEFVDLNKPEVVARTRVEVQRFHSVWLELAMGHCPDQAPTVVACMQGRKLLGLVIEEARHRESQLKSRLDEVSRDLRRLEISLSSRAGSQDLARRDAYDARAAEREGLLAELAGVHGFDEDAARRIDMERLQQIIAADQALVLLMQRAPGLETYPSAGASAMVIRSHVHSPVINLPDLGAMVHRMRSAASAGERMPGQRYSGWRTETAPTLSSNGDEGVVDLQDSLWAPLRDQLDGISTVHVVTTGESHLLPVASGAPTGLRIYQYPGLIFFGLRHGGWWDDRRGDGVHRAAEQSRALAAQVYSPPPGSGQPPIPFVDAEMQMVRTRWSPVHERLPLHDDVRVAVVHLAGHGQAGPDLDPYLLLGPDVHLGLHEVLTSRLRPEIVYLSACVAGRAFDDLDGEPLGLVSGFLLCGAKSVVAPLVPISDFHAPLLAILFHHALGSQSRERRSLDAWAALARAKEQLRQGSWPNEVMADVREYYVATVSKVLEATMAKSEWEFELRSLLSSWLDPACSVPAIYGNGGPYLAVREKGTRDAAEIVADLLLRQDVRSHLHRVPGVDGLLRYFTVFGAPENASGKAV